MQIPPNLSPPQFHGNPPNNYYQPQFSGNPINNNPNPSPLMNYPQNQMPMGIPSYLNSSNYPIKP